MEALEQSYRQWVLGHSIDGFTVSEPDEDRISFAGGDTLAEVVFYHFDDEPTIVELHIVEEGEEMPSFFLHFQLVEEDRARDLFDEMLEALREAAEETTVHILLSCTSGMTTGLFATRMQEAAKTLSLDYEFEALPVDEALAAEKAYAAILLAPQISYRRRDFAKVYPGQPIIEIPAKTFASLDAGTALRMVMQALLGSADVAMADAAAWDPSRIVRELDMDKRILVITAINRRNSLRLRYRLYDHGEVTLHGLVSKCRLDYRDIDDILSTISRNGVDVAKFDAVGIAVPAVVNRGSVILGGPAGRKDYDLGRHLAEKYGVKVFVDNNANAAAVGCYVSQTDYETITLHVQPLGYYVGGQGSIVDGRLVKGRLNMAGELGGPAAHMQISRDRNEAVWSSEGMTEIVANYLIAPLSVISPDAIYVACDLIPDMDMLRAELAKTMPEALIPDLHSVDDYREAIFVGELALCLGKLSDPRPHRKA